MRHPLYALFFFLFFHIHGFSQTKEISRDWTSFSQSLDASFLKKKTKFKLSASLKVGSNDTSARSGLFVRVENKDGEMGFYGNVEGRPEKISEWRPYEIEGTMDEHSKAIFVGAYCSSNGNFFFDNFEFYVEDDAGKLEKVKISNPGFEMPIAQNIIPNWTEGPPTYPVRVKGFSIQSSNDHAEGSHALLIEGRGIKRDSSYFIIPGKGYSPQIGALVSMLNNLSDRVEDAVQLLNQKETDLLFDNKANSIGALIMHLAAAEAYYQVYTFENRGFNEEEKKKWDVALNLGEEGRQQIKGHEIEYYLAIYKDVRKKTLEELAKRDDKWLMLTHPGDDINNYFSWFHIMEHQSSHLGQILFLKKRLPKREEPKPSLKIDYDH